MILNTKRTHNSFWGNFPARAFKSFICRQEKATTAAVRSLRAKIVIVAGNSKRVQNHHFCAKVLSLTQDESLRVRERHTTNRIPLVTTYNPRTSYIAEVANRNWHFLQSKERLAHIFRERPIIAYGRSKSLRDILFSTKLTGRTPEGHTTTMGSCGSCNKPKCSWCVLINKARGGMPRCLTYSIPWIVNKPLWFV